jgi:hypothetical protein
VIALASGLVLFSALFASTRIKTANQVSWTKDGQANNLFHLESVFDEND